MKQQLLFPAQESRQKPAISIPGFHLRLNYITADEELELLRHVDSGPWQHDWRRRIQVYGFGYSKEGGRQPAWIRDFPLWLRALADRVGADAQFERGPDNCVINEYVPPQGIGPHADYPEFGPSVACVSLGSGIVIDFAHAERGLRVPVYVPERSLWVISDEARWEWKHGIATRLSDTINGERMMRARRISITFRTARQVTPR